MYECEYVWCAVLYIESYEDMCKKKKKKKKR